MSMSNLSSAYNALRALAPAANEVRQVPFSDTGAEMPTELADALCRMGLLPHGVAARAVPQPTRAGDALYTVDMGWTKLCVKRAVMQPGEAFRPQERNRMEAAWLRFARAVVGEAVPEVLGEATGLFAMEHLDPSLHPTWLSQLRDGEISPSTAAETGRLIGRVHAASANNFAIAQRFDAEHSFDELRVRPLFRAAAAAQPALAALLETLGASVISNKLALLHGEVVPDNVLVGPRGPVLVDADASCYGDPAFDTASCLAQLLMLCVWRPQWRDGYLACFDAFRAAYLQRVIWEMPEQTDTRAAALVPAIMLGSALGGRPAKFLYGERERDIVVGFARRLLVDPLVRLAAVRESWRRSFLG